MLFQRACMFWCAAVVLHWSGAAKAVTIDFESLAVGTQYGGSAPTPNVPGQRVLEENGIAMSVETYFFSPVLTDFHLAEVVVQDGGSGADNALLLSSIGVAFDFAEVGFPVQQVTVGVDDGGGTSNFSVNGGTLHLVDPLTDLPAMVAPGVLAAVNEDRITLTSDTADILSFQIGGQELLIDNVTAVPEPGTGAVLAVLGVCAVLHRRRRVVRPARCASP